MKRKHIAIVTSKKSWFVPYARFFVSFVNKRGYKAELFHNYSDVGLDFQIVFLLSYFKIVKSFELVKHKHNLVIHESDLPKGKGWSPLFWQILEGKNNVKAVLFEADSKLDAGPIYLKENIKLSGVELHKEIRLKQAQVTLKLCWRFLLNYPNLRPKKQKGKETTYKKRTSENSELDPQLSLASQFNLLRIVDNEEFPAFFHFRGQKYILSIRKSYI